MRVVLDTNVIVSGDLHLLRLISYQEIPILTPRDFVAHLEAQSAE